MCSYVQMLDSKLPELQEIIATSKATVRDRLMILEYELGVVMADVGPGDDVPGGTYVNVWSGVGTALDNNQAVATLVGKIAQQVTTTAGRLEKLVAKANRVILEEGQVRAQVLSLNHSQRAEETKTNQIVDQLHTLALLLNQVQQDVQQHKLKVPNNAVLPEPSPNLMIPQGGPIEDAVLQLQIELQGVHSRLRSDTACVGGYTFESYEDTLKWVTISARNIGSMLWTCPLCTVSCKLMGKSMMYSCSNSLIPAEMILHRPYKRVWRCLLRPRFQ
jgi:hypothetical protein